jgi:hypothetical protein
MTSSKVILIGAISIVFGLYTLSLMRVGSLIGNTVVTNSYLLRANLNARTGIQRAMHRWTTGNFEASFGPSLVGDSSYSTSSVSSYYYTCTTVPNIAWLAGHYNNTFSDPIRLTIVSHGIYKAWGEPSAFAGHEVVRIAYAEFSNSDHGGPSYDVKFKMAYDSVNYVNEAQLDALQQNKGN